MRKPALVALLLAACGGPPAAGFSSGSGLTSAPASTGGSSTSSTGPADDPAGSGSAANSSAGVVRDVGAVDDFGTAQPVGYKGNVDLLFLISSLGTMKTEQAQLLASFAGFVATIQEKLTDFDVHIMVANPTAYWAGWSCEEFGCPDFAPNCGPDANDYQCHVYPKLITPCDYTLGAGLIFNAGDGAANRQCELLGGNRDISSGEPDMNDALECIAKVGWNGGDPPMGDALIAALAPKINAEGGCNAGFLRDDAILVVVLLNDTEDTESTSWPYPPDRVDLSRADLPPALAQVLTTALHTDDLATMDGLHAALREADVQAPDEAEAERRRYAAQLFDKPPSAPKPPPTPDEAPGFVDRYILCGELGKGGMGRARSAMLDTRSAGSRAVPRRSRSAMGPRSAANSPRSMAWVWSVARSTSGRPVNIS